MLSPSEPLLFYLGAALCLVVTAQAVLGTVGWFRARSDQRKRCDASGAEFRQLVANEAAVAVAKLSKRVAWEGWRTLKVSAVVDEAKNVKSFYLTDPEGMPLPRFLPGQYLTIEAPVGAGGVSVRRCYSLSDRPRSEYYRLTVKQQLPDANDRQATPGLVSTWLHEKVRQGDTLRCQAPRGVFFLDPTSPRPVVLIGAGVGATPLVSMLAAIQHAGTVKPTCVILSFRDSESHLLREAIEAARGLTHIRVRVVYSQPLAEDRLGIDYDLTGHVTMELLRKELPSNNFDFYVCGPAEMMQSLVPELLEGGIPDDAIHFEAFGPASVRTEANPTALERAVGSQVRFTSAGPFRWEGDYPSLLELAEARGIPVASGCRAGNCGACRVRVLKGSVTALRSTSVAIGEGECLACISLPDGEVTLDA
ncbi:2Fe-2S iron-sulfur cluster-binding protein [Botrimarina hoheduenensis]|uniref:Flavohemoprotein n=1 Tax=Botrimarina hoheduenensis TaxID=2528000 RepID=A0A5C5VZS8_9BACT|nr:2Fe-2S iron-sulfur cluster-binding protein [Botrimarina hoheduenensis]TWT43425.1 Flavohemoprotein [Botrimarina hoheduenensis]